MFKKRIQHRANLMYGYGLEDTTTEQALNPPQPQAKAAVATYKKAEPKYNEDGAYLVMVNGKKVARLVMKTYPSKTWRVTETDIPGLTSHSLMKDAKAQFEAAFAKKQ